MQRIQKSGADFHERSVFREGIFEVYYKPLYSKSRNRCQLKYIIILSLDLYYLHARNIAASGITKPLY